MDTILTYVRSLTLLDLLLLALSCWRLSYMLVKEDGPFRLFANLRTLILVNIGHSTPNVFNCIMCMSVWVAALVLLIYPFAPIVVWWLSISGAALMLMSYTGVGIHDGTT